MRLPKLKNWLLPIYLLAFAGSAVTFLSPVFNATSRWIVLAIVLSYLYFNGKLTRPLRTDFGILTLAFALWALATGIWSEVPELSYLKAVAFLFISLGGIAIGHAWVGQHGIQDSLKYLGPLTVVTILAGLTGQVTGEGYYQIGSVEVYQGMVSNPNMFGSLLAMCSPFLAWQIYCNWENKRKRGLWLIFGGISSYYLLGSSSRASFLVVLCMLLGFFLSMRHSRRINILALAGVLIASILVLAPQGVEQILNKYIYKGQQAEAGVTYSRDEVWSESYELAVKGGVIGGGYGVTIGDNSFQGGLTAIGYGREKGNSQFAIAEETGLVGLGIYLISLWFLFACLVQSFVRMLHGPRKALLGIVTGTLVGMIVQSALEAWWVSPASPESGYFWVLAGVALALTGKLSRKVTPRANPSQHIRATHISLTD